MRLVLAGTPDFASELFMPIIHSHHEILALIAQPDKPFGRKGELKAPSTKAMLCAQAQENPRFQACQILQPSHIDKECIERVRALKPQAILVVAYGKILPCEFLDIAPCINIHASILPQWRGASPIQQMILSQSVYFGVSAMRIEKGLDSGAILALSYVKNRAQDFPTLSHELAQKGAHLALKVLQDLEYTTPCITPLKQIHADASYCAKIKKSDGLVHFDCAKTLYSTYLAYCTWPHIFIQSTQGYILKLFEVEIVETLKQHSAGEILCIESQSIIVGCRRGSIRIKTLQQEGKSRLQASVYVRGKRLKQGDILQ